MPEASPGLLTVLSGVRGDTRRYRSLHTYQQLCLAGIPCQVTDLVNRQLPDLVARSQIVIFHRVAMDHYVRRLVEDLHRRGGLAILDIDDLLFDPAAFAWIDSPDFVEPVRAGLYREEMQRYLEMLIACDAVIAATEFLARRVQSFGKPAWVNRNAFSLEMDAMSEQARRSRPAGGNKIVIGYASGTLTHNKDFACISPALQIVLERHPQVELHIVGRLDLGPAWQPFSGRVRKTGVVDWRALPQLLARFDINLAPLVVDNPFNQSKSAIKYMEAALVGVPTVASPTEAFTECIQDGENGLLAGGNADWLAAIERLLDASERWRMGDAALRAVVKQDSAEARSLEWRSRLRAIGENSGKHGWGEESRIEKARIARVTGDGNTQVREPSCALDRTLERDPSRLQQAFYSLRHRGMRTLGRQVWAFFRRSITRKGGYK